MDPHILRRGLNALLPSDIWITHAERTPPQFHARYSAKGKIYEYRILNRTEPDIFARRCLWHIKEALDAEEMARCLSLLRGTHDFSAFRASGSGNVNPVRCVTQAALHGPEDGLLRVVMEADGFLRHMVRNIVGTVVEVGKGRMDYERFKQVFASKDRRLAGIKAPPQGLFLMNVQY
jgi:tRNA pseudouridine38-40 synthase